MSEILHLAAERPRLLQLTDLHLDGGSATLMGVDCQQSLAAVLKLVADVPAADATLLTGDLSQDRSRASYQRCHQMLSHLPSPVTWVPGNHDQPALMDECLGEAPFSAVKRLVFDHWQVVLLNSQLPGRICGQLPEDELARVAAAAAEFPDHHLLLVMHHHPVPMHSEWLDHHRLLNSDALWQCLADVPQARGILFGHVHQEVDRRQQGVRVLATPATSVQFKPQSDDFGIDPQSPGFRTLALESDGQITTEVHRLAPGQFVAIDDPRGY